MFGPISEYPFIYLSKTFFIVFYYLRKKHNYKPIDSIHILMDGQVFCEKCNTICSSKYTYLTWEESFQLGTSWGSNISALSLHMHQANFAFKIIYLSWNQLFLWCMCITDHFTVVRLVAWPLNRSEAGVDLVLRETSLLFLL